ncbi:unnamed protein product [Rhizophagus irregularis]|nr:unnamed protein product [Rhizophagus irregularis]CAB4384852.1 unnamed protein product [Rhizophagus irregularis]CAB4384889.1 unnamed protein product [Rhizophagus irregularis]CAB5311062.1 unnamed protein product [Rhizophagus irregularis]CAB5357814.1 unnamed protein product [Rhizophagus irregularis]
MFFYAFKIGSVGKLFFKHFVLDSSQNFILDFLSGLVHFILNFYMNFILDFPSGLWNGLIRRLRTNLKTFLKFFFEIVK